MGNVVLERRFLLKDPIEISESEFRDKVSNRHSDGAIGADTVLANDGLPQGRAH